ncbi:hypothetical protein [Pseudoalteromonas piscicida]|uniref:Uncharacterized protein n=1 Tax=Pseudoalteromonas piscicida TaxID=43662 RepID=A0A2A5JMP2_PSEO7|nr:hypothetical protein [Pseudoalteromonas piscicida]PCK30734.1 hypothetical protein CEX98_15790 [Pseudoalteromonas piscicida]
MRNILIIFYFFSFASFADMVPPDVELTPKNAFCLGFTLERPTDEFVGLNYPKVIEGKWTPVSTVVEYRLNENPIFITKTNFEKVNELDATVILGFHETIHSGGDAAVLITYQCTSKCGTNYLKSYSVPSIVKYIEANVKQCL